ncbi:hypothetical protein PV325_002642 [Microctonus aethiopoides]|nr:hypothetical protein PV325_002642 [Microctonus aethiopoides]
MSLEGKYNTKSPAVKRLMREAQELHEATNEYHACPLDDNLFEWHFTVRGPPSTEFESGVYHGRITLPAEYPMKPPNIILLTPNGRFEVQKKLCLSISGHHPETWQPSWSIRTALLALIAFMPTPGNGTIGSLDYSAEERQKLAKKSSTWKCDICGRIDNLLANAEQTSVTKSNSQAEELRLNSSTLQFQGTASSITEATLNTSSPVDISLNEGLRQRLIDSQRQVNSSSIQQNSVANSEQLITTISCII